MTEAYIYFLEAVLELRPTDQQSDTLIIRTLGARIVLSIWALGSNYVKKDSDNSREAVIHLEIVPLRLVVEGFMRGGVIQVRVIPGRRCPGGTNVNQQT